MQETNLDEKSYQEGYSDAKVLYVSFLNASEIAFIAVVGVDKSAIMALSLKTTPTVPTMFLKGYKQGWHDTHEANLETYSALVSALIESNRRKIQ